jgi:hypothetical protein
MKEEIQIFVGNNGLDLKDFYPDDLPKEWRFDYYSTQHKSVMIGCGEDIDFEDIFEDIDEDFKLVIDISNSQNIDFLLKNISNYKDNFIFYSDNDKFYNNIKNYNFCIQSEKVIKGVKNIDNLYFNDYVVILTDKPNDNQDAKKVVEKVSDIGSNVVIIYKNSDTETLADTRVIIELLGFF